MKSIIYLFLALSVLTSCAVRKKGIRTDSTSSGKIIERPSPVNRANIKSYYAEVLNTEPKNLNEDLYELIDEWMGSPHRLGGDNKNGVDCSWFVGLIYQQVYHKNLPRMSKDMAEFVKRKYDNQLQEGDLVFFSFGGKSIDHVGVYLHNDKFVHVSTSKGVIISNLKDVWYYKYLSRCGTPVL